MKWFYNMKITAKLLTGFILVAVVVGIVGYVGIINIKTLDNSDTELYENVTVPIAEAGDMGMAFQRIRVSIRDMIAANDPQSIQNQADQIAAYRAEISKLSESFEQKIISDEMKSAFQEFVDSRKVYGAELDAVMALAVQNQDVEALARLAPTGSAGMASQAEQDALDKVIKMKVEDGKDKSDTNTVQANGAVSTMTIIMVVGVLIAIALGLFLSNIISKPLKKAAHMISEMSMGHFGERLEMDTKDEIGRMAVAMDQFADDLQNVVIGTMNQISEGDVSANIEVRDPQDEIAPALKRTIETIRALIAEAGMLSQAAVAQQWHTRGNADHFNGGFKEVVVGVNATLDTVVDKMIWYEALLDAVPFLMSATDLDMNWTFINKPVENLLGVKRKDVLGKQCSNWNATICNTENCGVAGLRRDKLQNLFEQQGMNFQVDTAYISNDKGAKVGHIEIVQDITGQTKVSDYQGIEVERLASNLVCLSEGNLNFDMNLQKADDYTMAVSLQFNKISETLGEVKQSISNLVADAGMLAQAGIDGRLDTRADASRHLGDFAKIVNGVNATLDAVVAPVKEASATLKELAQGNLNTGMTGNYNGDYTLIKDDMNQTVAFLKRYVGEITYTLEGIGRGNLDQHITAEYLGDFIAIKRALNDITSNLSTTMSDINIAAGQVEIGSQQISDGGQALSQGTTEQASSIQELTASIEEVAGETKKNAMHANEANERAIEVRKNAEVGNAQMNTMIEAMLEINDSSNNISKIIKVIDDIAFQTNILALNAAVEAARAGQHGKGFAVVAEEVRNLAARSAEAAKETTGLIEGSIDKVEVGTKIADQTAESLKEILSEIEKVTGLVGDIAQASNDQATEIAQITQGIEQVSQVVQTNSATAEESAAASEELSGQAEMLKQMVGTFKLKGNNLGSTGTPQKMAGTRKTTKQRPTSQPQINLDDDADKY